MDDYAVIHEDMDNKDIYRLIYDIFDDSIDDKRDTNIKINLAEPKNSEFFKKFHQRDHGRPDYRRNGILKYINENKDDDDEDSVFEAIRKKQAIFVDPDRLDGIHRNRPNQLAQNSLDAEKMAEIHRKFQAYRRGTVGRNNFGYLATSVSDVVKNGLLDVSRNKGNYCRFSLKKQKKCKKCKSKKK